MSQVVSTSFTITRLIDVPVAYDAAGQAICEAQDIDIDGTVSGIYCPAEPDVGIMTDWFDDVTFTGDDGAEWDLNNQECSRAVEWLMEALVNSVDE